ncbi:MAG TPA: hypothetical protein DEH78_11580, partial [Solibacterales bacterium]|nr:hypothetical protein [Bryobacterales bacterium]
MPKLAAAVDRPAILVAGSAALCVVLLSLAWLQYRWIGQLSDAERARLQARLHESGRAFADEFDGLLLEVAQQVLAPRGPFESPEQRLRVWLEFARYPRLIEGFFVVEDGQVRSVAVSDGRTPEPERIPSAVRAVLDAPGPPAPMGRGLGPPLVEGPGVLAMMTIRGRPNAGGPPPGVFGFRRPGPRPMPAERPVWVIAVIDLGVVTRELLPELSRRHFGPDWQVTVRALRDDRIVYQSALQPHRPEFTTPLLEIRPGRPEAEQRPPGPGRPPREPRWQLEVAPTRGTLEELVDAARTRNLALSGAALGLLCAAAGLLMLSLARARRLSRLRMELVAGVSHELRTPVAVIVSAADNLADGVVTTPEQ